MTNDIFEWQRRFNIPQAAIIELFKIIVPDSQIRADDGHTEAYSTSLIRLEAAQKGVRLWRNNVGALKDENGRWVRFGLANESARLNAKLKSSDWIGWRRTLITPRHVGCTIGQACLREMKRPGWKYTGTEREQAQLQFLTLAALDGCDASFATGPGTL